MPVYFLFLFFSFLFLILFLWLLLCSLLGLTRPFFPSLFTSLLLFLVRPSWSWIRLNCELKWRIVKELGTKMRKWSKIAWCADEWTRLQPCGNICDDTHPLMMTFIGVETWQNQSLSCAKLIIIFPRTLIFMLT